MNNLQFKLEQALKAEKQAAEAHKQAQLLADDLRTLRTLERLDQRKIQLNSTIVLATNLNGRQVRAMVTKPIGKHTPHTGDLAVWLDEVTKDNNPKKNTCLFPADVETLVIEGNELKNS